MKPGSVAFSLREVGIIAKDSPGAFIPPHHIHPLIEEFGWIGEAIKNGLSSCIGDGLVTIRLIQWRNRTLCQEKQMAALLGVQLQDGCEPLQHLIGYLNIAALLQPSVPGNTHTNELGKLFSSETMRSSFPKCREVKLFWMQASTPIL